MKKLSTPCWKWPNTNFAGYGVIHINRKASYVHRIMYAFEYGEIPDGYEIHHLCENRSCCRPDHLKMVTHKEHFADHHSIGKELIEEIRRRRAEGDSARQIARLLDVSLPTVTKYSNDLMKGKQLPQGRPFYAIKNPWPSTKYIEGKCRCGAIIPKRSTTRGTPKAWCSDHCMHAYKAILNGKASLRTIIFVD